jgi:osmotically-inducible protein OsmY
MYLRTTLASAMTALMLLTASGCAVMRGQENTSNYVDDAAITTAVKAKLVENKDVDAGAIKVETLNNTVMLSGFAKSALEKSTAESIAMQTKGVRNVKNQIVVRP